MVKNPFIFGKPILDPACFFGRKQEVKQAFDYLHSAQNISVVGERRIGKTSFLKYISHPDILVEHGFDKRKSIFVYVDLQSLASNATPADFWGRLLTDIQSQASRNHSREDAQQTTVEEQAQLRSIENIIDRLHAKGVRVFLLLDEIEKTKSFGNVFFENLRSLSGHHGLTLMIASRSGLEEMGSSEDSSSSFFNIFATIQLSCFTLRAAEELIDRSLHGADANAQFEREEKELAYSLSGLYPFFLQMACWYLFGGRQDGLELEERMSWVRQQMYEQAKGHFNYFWQQSSEQEKETLAILKNHSTPKQHGVRLNELSRRHVDEKVVRSLIKRGLLQEKEGQIIVFSPLFVDWLVENQADSSINIVPASKRMNRFLISGIIFVVALVVVGLLIFQPQILERIGLWSAAVGQFLIEAQHYIIGTLAVVLFMIIVLLGLIGKWDAATNLLKRILKILVN